MGNIFGEMPYFSIWRVLDIWRLPLELCDAIIGLIVRMDAGTASVEINSCALCVVLFLTAYLLTAALFSGD